MLSNPATVEPVSGVNVDETVKEDWEARLRDLKALLKKCITFPRRVEDSSCESSSSESGYTVDSNRIRSHLIRLLVNMGKQGQRNLQAHQLGTLRLLDES